MPYDMVRCVMCYDTTSPGMERTSPTTPPAITTMLTIATRRLERRINRTSPTPNTVTLPSLLPDRLPHLRLRVHRLCFGRRGECLGGDEAGFREGCWGGGYLPGKFRYLLSRWNYNSLTLYIGFPNDLTADLSVLDPSDKTPVSHLPPLLHPQRPRDGSPRRQCQRLYHPSSLPLAKNVSPACGLRLGCLCYAFGRDAICEGGNEGEVGRVLSVFGISRVSVPLQSI
jgi:hypothetical protein